MKMFGMEIRSGAGREAFSEPRPLVAAAIRLPNVGEMKVAASAPLMVHNQKGEVEKTK